MPGLTYLSKNKRRKLDLGRTPSELGLAESMAAAGYEVSPTNLPSGVSSGTTDYGDRPTLSRLMAESADYPTTIVEPTEPLPDPVEEMMNVSDILEGSAGTETLDRILDSRSPFSASGTMEALDRRKVKNNGVGASGTATGTAQPGPLGLKDAKKLGNAGMDILDAVAGYHPADKDAGLIDRAASIIPPAGIVGGVSSKPSAARGLALKSDDYTDDGLEGLQEALDSYVQKRPTGRPPSFAEEFGTLKPKVRPPERYVKKVDEVKTKYGDEVRDEGGVVFRRREGETLEQLEARMGEYDREIAKLMAQYNKRANQGRELIKRYDNMSQPTMSAPGEWDKLASGTMNRQALITAGDQEGGLTDNPDDLLGAALGWATMRGGLGALRNVSKAGSGLLAAKPPPPLSTGTKLAGTAAFSATAGALGGELGNRAMENNWFDVGQRAPKEEPLARLSDQLPQLPDRRPAPNMLDDPSNLPPQVQAAIRRAEQVSERYMDAADKSKVIGLYNKGAEKRAAQLIDKKDMAVPGRITNDITGDVRDAAARVKKFSSGGVPSKVPEQYRASVAKWGKYLEERMKANGLVDVPGGLPSGMSGAEYLAKILQAESGWDERIGHPDNTSPRLAQGLGQFIPSTRQAFLEQFGVDAYADAEQQIQAAAYHLDGDHTAGGLESYNPGFPETSDGTWGYYLDQEVGSSAPARPNKLAKAEDLMAAAQRRADLFDVDVASATPQGGGNDQPNSVTEEPSIMRNWSSQGQGSSKTKWFVPDENTLLKFQAPLGKALLQLAKASGEPISFNSGFRTFAEQEAAYADYQAGGALAAVPGTSNHEFGKAADVNLTDTQRSMLSDFGLGLPVPGEDWHVELVGDAASAYDDSWSPGAGSSPSSGSLTSYGSSGSDGSLPPAMTDGNVPDPQNPFSGQDALSSVLDILDMPTTTVGSYIEEDEDPEVDNWLNFMRRRQGGLL